MSIHAVSEKASRAIFGTLQVSPSESQTKDVVTLIEQAMIDALIEANQRSTKAAQKCCSADRDMAHKIAAEIERSHRALIANLSGMR
jgi:hypothetical protein